MIKATDIHKTFRVHEKQPGLLNSVRSLFKRTWIDKNALSGVSLDIGEGEIVGLIGANGAGKTTLIKILSGIIHPTSGSARVIGHDPWQRKNEFRRSIALIMGQKAQLWWDLPAADCFLLLKEIYQIPDKEYHDNLDYLSQTLDIKSQLTIQIRRLSLGERMKMELIAALLHNPRVVFLDEPTIGLDLTAQRAIRRFILEYRSKHRPAMILTSHYMDDIEALCKRIIILRQGSIVYDGSLEQVVRKFADEKIISVITKANSVLTPFSFPDELGQIIDDSNGRLRIKVKRDRLSEAASLVLSKVQVSDLSIEDQDISTIIESLLAHGAVS